MSAYIEFKEMEGARILPLLGAVAALPGAALVLSKSDAAAGAPLFVVSLTFIAAAYLMWLCSDSVFAIAFDYYEAHQEQAGDDVSQLGYYFSWSTLAYGMLSLLATVAGFAGVHSTLRTPISVEMGFIVAIAVVVLVCGHCAHAVYLRNKSNAETS